MDEEEPITQEEEDEYAEELKEYITDDDMKEHGFEG